MLNYPRVYSHDISRKKIKKCSKKVDGLYHRIIAHSFIFKAIAGDLSLGTTTKTVQTRGSS